jgi:uracil phosphoribosyltransferase
MAAPRFGLRAMAQSFEVERIKMAQKSSTKKTTSSTPKNLVLLEHPILRHKLTRLRDENTKPADFRRSLNEMSGLLAFEATRELNLKTVPINTPLEAMDSPVVADRVLIVPILRAGSGMLEGVLQVLPFARVGHIGIYRDKFLHSTIEYYLRIPKDIKEDKVLLLDPLCATGDTAVAAIERLKGYHVGEISLITVLAAEAGLSKLQEQHPDVKVYTVSFERELNKAGYILPGLGDAGDRLFDTF